MNRIKNISFALIQLAVFSFFLMNCAVNPVTGKKELMLVTESEEIAMGLQYDPEVISEFGLYQDEKLQAFINEKGKQMGAISHRPHLEYHFRIVDSPVVNAFAVPGGYVYFTRGILAYFNNEAEFAGVLGHEIGHITARHTVSQMSKQTLYGGLLVAGMLVSEDFRQFSDLAGVGLGLLFLKFGRDDESQSDELGVDYSTQIGYNSHEMANFFGVLKRLQDESGQSIPTFLSTHPDPGNRYTKVHQLSDSYISKRNLSNLKVNRDVYLRMIDGIVYGEDPRQGYVEYNTFFHPTMRFYFPVPAGWEIINTANMVQMAAPDGKAIMLLTLSKKTNLAEAAEETIQQDQLQVLERSNLRVNGNPAIAMISVLKSDPNQEQTDQQQELRILTYLIQYNGSIYKFHGLSASTDFNSYYRTFLNTMDNFNKLTDPSKINVNPDRIKIIEAIRDETLQSVLERNGVASDMLDHLSALNNMQLSSPLKKGTLVKMVVPGRFKQ